MGPITPYVAPRKFAEPDPPAGSAELRLGTLRVRVNPALPETIECEVLMPQVTADEIPVVVVPFYSASSLIGDRDPGTAERGDAKRANALHLAQRGFVTVAVPWWFETHRDEGDTLAAKYAAPAALHRRNHPAMTGLGRAVADLVAVLDSLPWIGKSDRQQVRLGEVGCYGHSLGGKLVLFLSALDERVGVAVASEPGLGFNHSNWADQWYFGEVIPVDRTQGTGHDMDEVASLIPPRHLMLIRGGEADGDHNNELLMSARQRSERGDALVAFDHPEGHTPSWSALGAAYEFLSAKLKIGGQSSGKT